MARLPTTPSIGARDHGEGQVALGLGERGLQFVERARGLVPLRLQHLDVGLGRVDAGLRALHRGCGLRRVGLRVRAPACWRNSRAASACWRSSSSCGAGCAPPAPRRAAPWPASIAACCASTCWPMRSIVACWVATLSRAASTASAIVAVVDLRDHVAGAHLRVVLDADRRDIARDLGGERRVVRAHIGVVGRHHEAADRPPVVAVPAAGAERREQRDGGDRLAVQLRLCGCGGGFLGHHDGPGRPGSVRLYHRRSRGDGGVRAFGGGLAASLAAGVAASVFCQAGRPRPAADPSAEIAIPIHGGVPSSPGTLPRKRL